jgi:dihydroorotate dehydrogenase (NAD+) catalytic subunit
MSKKPDLKVNLGAIELQNPVMTASGTFGYAREFEGLVDLNRLGGIIVKGLSLEPTKGNPPPRIVETPCGMLNAIGLENVGIDVFVKEKLPFLQNLFPPVFANIYGTSIEEYAELAARIDELEAISGVEVNISCHRKTVTERDRYHHHRAICGGGRSRCAFSYQHHYRHGHRY